MIHALWDRYQEVHPCHTTQNWGAAGHKEIGGCIQGVWVGQVDQQVLQLSCHSPWL